MRKILIGAGVLLVIGIGALLVVPALNTGNAQAATTTTRTAQVELTTLYDTVDGSGSIAAEQTFQLSFGTSGTVQDVMVEVGDAVTAGQPLAVLDTSDLELDVRLAELALMVQQAEYDRLVADPDPQDVLQAQAQLVQARAQLESAQASAESAEDELTNSCSGLETARRSLQTAQAAYDDYLVAGYEQDPNFTPDPDASVVTALTDAQSAYDRAEAQCNIAVRSQSSRDLESAQLNLEQAQLAYDDLMDGPDPDELASAESKLLQAQIQLEQAQQNLADATITAPFDGVITEVNIVNGQAVSAATTAMVIADTSRLHVDVSVDELDVVQVAEGQTVQITLEAFEDTTVSGVVRRISPSGTQSQGLVTYTVRVDLDTAPSAATSSSTQAQPGVVGTGAATGGQAASGSAGFVPAQANAAASAGSGAATSSQAAAPPAMPAGAGGMTYLRQVMPVLMQNGGVEALTAMLAREGGEDEFYTLLRDAGIAEDVITQIQENGGPQALAEVLAQFGAGPQGQAGSAPAAMGQAADQTAGTDQASVSVELPAIRLGMTADVEIVVSMQENVLVVPTSAIQREGQQEYLLVDDGNGGQTRVVVTSGVTRSGMTVITGDVTAGQVVYIPVTSDSSSSSSSLRPGGGMGLLTGGGGMPGGAPPAGGPGGQ